MRHTEKTASKKTAKKAAPKAAKKIAPKAVQTKAKAIKTQEKVVPLVKPRKKTESTSLSRKFEVTDIIRTYISGASFRSLAFKIENNVKNITPL